MSAPPILARIVAPHFVAGIEVDAETHRVCRAAPIVAYMRGWCATTVADYCARKRWTIARVDAPDVGANG